MPLNALWLTKKKNGCKSVFGWHFYWQKKKIWLQKCVLGMNKKNFGCKSAFWAWSERTLTDKKKIWLQKLCFGHEIFFFWGLDIFVPANYYERRAFFFKALPYNFKPFFFWFFAPKMQFLLSLFSGRFDLPEHVSENEKFRTQSVATLENFKYMTEHSQNRHLKHYINNCISSIVKPHAHFGMKIIAHAVKASMHGQVPWSCDTNNQILRFCVNQKAFWWDFLYELQPVLCATEIRKANFCKQKWCFQRDESANNPEDTSILPKFWKLMPWKTTIIY